jgi:predicted TIM-barrel fold metal-dependent hydrolase
MIEASPNVAQSRVLISADEHVIEHPGVWTERMSKNRWGTRIPHTERKSDGTEHWTVDGEILPLPGVALSGALLSDPCREVRRWVDVPNLAYVPDERLKAMDASGVNFAILYPTVAGVAGETFARLDDPELELACVQAYNDWLIEEWANRSQRFVPQCIVPIYPPAASIAEIKRAVKKGHKGVIYPAIPMQIRNVPHINDPQYDLIWATCQELGVPLCLHAGSSNGVQIPIHPGMSPRVAAALQAVLRPASAVFDVANILFSRILMRFPNLKVIFAESTVAWGAFLLEYADHQFQQDRCEGYELKPSEMFTRQCFLTTWYNRVRTDIGYLGADNILWATNFPLANSTWPDVGHFVERGLSGIPKDERDKILWENAAKLYQIS